MTEAVKFFAIRDGARDVDCIGNNGSGAKRCPDIILIMNTAGGWNSIHEGEVLPGWHGGPSKADTMVPFALGFAGLKLNNGNQILKDVINKAETNRPTSDSDGPLQNRDMHKVMVDLLQKLNPKN